MHAPTITPSIEVTIGRETRLYHAFITTAPTTLDAPATVTLHTAPLSDVSRHGGGSDRLRSHAREVIRAARSRRRDRTGLAARTLSRGAPPLRTGRSRARWTRTRCSTGCGTGSDRPRRISNSRTHSNATNTRPGRARSGHFSEGRHEHRSQDSSQRTRASRPASWRTQRSTSSTESSPASS